MLLVTAPAYVGLALVAEPAVLTLFGPKWAEMAPLVSGLALAMPFMALQIVCSPATNATGRPAAYLMTNGAGALLFPLLFVAFVGRGAEGLVIAWWIGAPALLAITLALTLPRVGLGFGRLAGELAPVLAACAAMALAVTVVGNAFVALPAPALLAVLAAVGALFYGATLWIAWPRLLRETWEMLRRPREVAAGDGAPLAA